MAIILGIFAFLLFIMYSLYFVRIIKGTHLAFEQELLAALADWMISVGANARRQTWLLIISAVILEIVYFVLTFMVMENLLILTFTAAFALLETIHIFSTINNFAKFFKGTIVLKQIFEWRVERISAIVFFTHSFLVLACLLFF